MKALLYTAPMTFEYTDVPDPVPGPDDVLIRVKAVGICGSDVHGATGKTGRRLPPLIMGHEAAGVIESVGGNVADLQPGDRVCFDSTVYCNQCEACRNRKFNRCAKRQVLGVSTPEFKRHGAMAERVCVPSWIVFRIPDEMSFVQAALLEPVSIGTHAANRGNIKTGCTVLVIGAGTIGLCVLAAARLNGAGKIIVSDIDDFRLDTAKRLGADVTVNVSRASCPRIEGETPSTQETSSSLKQTVMDHTDGKGVHSAFEVVGLLDTFQSAVACTRTGGTVVAVGNIQPKAEFNLQQFIASELTITGSYASSGEFEQCIDLVASGRIDVEPLISEVQPLHEGARAFERLLEAKENLLKIVLES